MNKSGRLRRFTIRPSLRGKGTGTTALETIASHAFEDMGLRRLDLMVSSENAQAIKCYGNAGFRVEGRLRDARLFEGVWRDMLIMSALKT